MESLKSLSPAESLLRKIRKVLIIVTITNMCIIRLEIADGTLDFTQEQEVQQSPLP